MFSKFGNFFSKDREYRNKKICIFIYFSQFGEISQQKKEAKIGLNILVKKFPHKCDQTIVLGYTTHYGFYLFLSPLSASIVKCLP
jgi:hypothetical protein